MATPPKKSTTPIIQVPAKEPGDQEETLVAGPPIIPDFELLRCIGKGSYGEVWLARSVTGLLRAVKVVRRGASENDDPFHREFAGIQKYEPVSRGHESLVDILHVGKGNNAECFYVVMELGDDLRTGREIAPETYAPRTLRTDIQNKGRLSVGECVELGLSLASGLTHLHGKGLIHRDVKPSNVIFVNGMAKLADIGLVTEIGRGTYIGTEGYIPPEGSGRPEADIYALGMVLYEASTGKDRLDFPEIPSNIDGLAGMSGFPAFNRLILRACAREAEGRFRTAADMHAELAVLGSGGACGGRRRTSRLPHGRRKRVAQILGGLCALALIVAATVLLLPTRQDRPRFVLPSDLPASAVLEVAYAGSTGSDAIRPRPEAALQVLARPKGAKSFTPVANGARLTSLDDDYFIAVTMLSKGYLYVFQVDTAGRCEWLFPKNAFSSFSSGENPVGAGTIVQVPPPETNTVLYLDENPGVEHVYAAVSAHRWRELEAALGQSATSVSAGGDDSAAAHRVTRPLGLRTRGIGGTRAKETRIDFRRVVDGRPVTVSLLNEPVAAVGGSLVVERWFHHGLSDTDSAQ